MRFANDDLSFCGIPVCFEPIVMIGAKKWSKLDFHLPTPNKPLPQQIISRLSRLMAFILLLVVVGSLGFIILEGWSVIDSFYMTVITLSTVGFGEANELSHAGRIYTSILIICSMLMVTCWTAGVTSMVVSGDFTRAFYQYKASKMAKKSKEHTIVCGDGQFVELVLRQLLFEGHKVVFLSSDEPQIKKISKRFTEVPVVEGSPLLEDSLLAASIVSATNLVVVMESEHDNLLVSMTGKELNENLCVMAKADSDPVATRMRRVGIDGIISPMRLGANRISAHINQAALRSSSSQAASPERGALNQIDEMQTGLKGLSFNDDNVTELASVDRSKFASN